MKNAIAIYWMIALSLFHVRASAAQDAPPNIQLLLANASLDRPIVMRSDAVQFSPEQLRQFSEMTARRVVATQKQLEVRSANQVVAKTAPQATASIPTNPGPAEVIQARAAQGRYEIGPEDETLYLALRRWATESGYQLVWSAGKDFPVKRTVYEAEDLSAAVALAMKDTELSAYPLHACTYQNRVIRVLHVSQSCVPK